MNNTDSPGGDYLDFPSPSATDEDMNVINCSETCQRENRCLAWSYVRPGYPAPLPPFIYAPRCSLKTTAPAFASKSMCCVTGRVHATVITLLRDKSGTTGTATPIVGKFSSFPSRVQRDGIAVVDVRVLVDHSVVEVFVNRGRERLTGRLYIPLQANESSGVALMSNVPNSTLVDGSVWSVASIWL